MITVITTESDHFKKYQRSQASSGFRLSVLLVNAREAEYRSFRATMHFPASIDYQSYT
jgi:hypothetical protein